LATAPKANATAEVKKAERAIANRGDETLVVLAFSADQKRVMGLEPTTATLATWRSTTELHPQEISPSPLKNYKGDCQDDKVTR
jgi:hypothetical protein